MGRDGRSLPSHPWTGNDPRPPLGGGFVQRFHSSLVMFSGQAFRCQALCRWDERATRWDETPRSAIKNEPPRRQERQEKKRRKNKKRGELRRRQGSASSTLWMSSFLLSLLSSFLGVLGVLAV